MSIKQNFVYNIFLTLSTYIAGLIVYPYVSRVLGVENMGVFSFVNKTIDFIVLFSVLGVTTVGIREIASFKGDTNKMSEVFSSLLSFVLIATFIVIAVFLLLVHFVPKFALYESLFYIGISKILFTSLLIEWFFQGLENFRYVAIRNVVVKIIYIVSVFLLVKKSEDYYMYFVLTCLMTVINAIINWMSSRKFVTFHFDLSQSKSYLKPISTYGAYHILDSMYSTFNYIMIGVICSQIEVGYYYTANNLYLIFLGVISALTRVLMPRMCSMIKSENSDGINSLIYTSFDLILSLCVPLAILGVAFSPVIVQIIAGPGYEGAILPLRIMMILVIVNAINQIFIVQIMTSYRMDKPILYGTIFAALFSIIANFLLLKPFGAVGSSIVLALSVICASSYPIYKLLKSKVVQIPWRVFVTHFKLSFPYFILAGFESCLPTNAYLFHGLIIVLAFCYFFLIKGRHIISLIKK